MTMEICHAYTHRPIRLSATRRYTWDQVRAMCKRVSGPFSLNVEDKFIPIPDESTLRFACQASAAYHDWVAYNVPEEDGFCEEMAEIERKVLDEMEDVSDYQY
jgi:hypothetical protein